MTVRPRLFNHDYYDGLVRDGYMIKIDNNTWKYTDKGIIRFFPKEAKRRGLIG